MVCLFGFFFVLRTIYPICLHYESDNNLLTKHWAIAQYIFFLSYKFCSIIQPLRCQSYVSNYQINSSQFDRIGVLRSEWMKTIGALEQRWSVLYFGWCCAGARIRVWNLDRCHHCGLLIMNWCLYSPSRIGGVGNCWAGWNCRLTGWHRVLGRIDRCVEWVLSWQIWCNLRRWTLRTMPRTLSLHPRVAWQHTETKSQSGDWSTRQTFWSEWHLHHSPSAYTNSVWFQLGPDIQKQMSIWIFFGFKFAILCECP